VTVRRGSQRCRGGSCPSRCGAALRRGLQRFLAGSFSAGSPGAITAAFRRPIATWTSRRFTSHRRTRSSAWRAQRKATSDWRSSRGSSATSPPTRLDRLSTAARQREHA
jgi:hypothetical protein